MQRRILRIDHTGVTVAQSARFESEQRLHEAISSHPEVLPHEDLGFGPLIPLAVELDLGSGPMDLLAADPEGCLVIIEFKRGIENPDVRQVVAQILDYGSSLWRYGYEALEEQCLRRVPGPSASLAEVASDRFEALGQAFDEGEFRSGIEASLDSGAFRFVYCGRDLDDRTRRIMTYLAEGARMTFFAVEVDYYREGASDNAVLVPRATFIPSWVTAPETGQQSARGSKRSIVDASPEFYELVELMNEVATEIGLQVSRRPTGWNYLPPVIEEGVRYGQSGVGVYASSRGVEFNVSVLKDLGHREFAEALLRRLGEIAGIPISLQADWPSVPYSAVLGDWERVQSEVIEPYFRARMGYDSRLQIDAVAGSVQP